ncbi:unnamed protein product [Camellia sinensis]
MFTMERARSQETGIFKKKPADLMQIFKDVQSKVSDVVLGKEKPVEESNPEYEKLKHYIFELEDHLAEAQKHAYRLVKRHRELGQSLSDFGKAVKLLGTCEGDALGKVFSKLGAKSEILSIKLQKEFSGLIRRLPCCWVGSELSLLVAAKLSKDHDMCSLESVSMAEGGLSMVAAMMVSAVLCYYFIRTVGCHYKGTPYSLCKIKMVIELLEGIHFVSSVEAISLGAQAGIHPWIIYDIVSNAARNSWWLDESIMPDGFLSNLKGIVLDMAKSCTFPLPLLVVAFQHLIAGSSHGHGNDGDDTLIKAWEKVYGVNITNAVNMIC